MMIKHVYVVRDTELGWDNIVDIYTTEDEANKAAAYRGGETTFVTSETLSDKFEVY